ncbi:hypothetical protein [Pseudothauera hydrothermalis]|uniref:hypothetical protein n=1 Tax=Pseudothauera hydrothermalis TaxID=2184083 RepID=UPI0013C2F855|nr:hypothetical protein [Pseudothauera hydrothermalis]
MDRCDTARDAEIDGLRRRLIAILIKDEAAFEALRERLSQAMTRAWSFGVEAAFRRALEALRGVDPARFSKADEARVLAAIEAEVGGEAMRLAMEGPVATLPQAIYEAEAMAAARRAAGVDYAFGVKDEAALDLVRRFDLHWIARHWDAGTRHAVTGAVAEFFEGGWTYETLADRLRQACDGIEARGMAYWHLTADTIATKTRELGRVAGYEQAGVRYLEVRAHIDERTTPICRSMHGRLIRLETIQRQRDKYLSAIERGHMEAAKAAWPMWDAGMAMSGGTKVLPANVGLPPYHFRCRTVTVAYLGVDPEVIEQEADEIERWQMAARQREQLPKRELLRLIERARMARWDSLSYVGRHIDKHRHGIAKALGKKPESITLDEYNAMMDDLIRRGDREIALSLRRGRLYAEFFRQTEDGRRLTAVVNVSDGKRTTLHVKRDADGGSLRNELFAPQGGKGVQKWLGW